MLHYIFALFIFLLSDSSIFTEFTQAKIPQSKSSQNCSAILDSISKESKDKKEKTKQDLDKITVFIPTKEFYKKKLLDSVPDNDQSISTPQALKEEEDEDDDDDDDEKEIDQITRLLQNLSAVNNSHLEINNNAVTVNPNYGIGIVPEEKQQNKKKTQLDVNLNLALHLDFDKNLELIYSKHKDFCKDKEIIPDKDTSCKTSFFTLKKILCIGGGACLGIGVACLIIKTAPVTVPIAVAVAAARKDSKLNYAFCAPCDDFTTNQDQNLPIIWILAEENQFNSTKENIITGLTQEGSIKIPTGATAIGVAGAAAGAAGLGLSIGLGSGAGTVAATAGGIVITGTVIPVIIGSAVVGYTIKLSIDALRELIQYVKHKRAEKKAKKLLEKNNAGGSNNSNSGNNNNDKDPKDKKDLTPKPKVVEDILKDAEPGEKTKGRADQYVKPGGYENAFEDFKKSNPTDVKKMDGKEGWIGTLPDGRTITVRIDSSDKRPTLEIKRPDKTGRIIKIRYGNKPN